jgi:hypothetical protein
MRLPNAVCVMDARPAFGIPVADAAPAEELPVRSKLSFAKRRAADTPRR